MSAVKFPQTVKNGSCAVKIYAPPKDGNEGYTLCYYVRGARRRKTYTDYAAAKKEAEVVVAQMAHGELDILTLRDQDRLVHLRATEALAPTGRPLDAAATEFAQAVKLLNGESLLDAVRALCSTALLEHLRQSIAALNELAGLDAGLIGRGCEQESSAQQ